MCQIEGTIPLGYFKMEHTTERLVLEMASEDEIVPGSKHMGSKLGIRRTSFNPEKCMGFSSEADDEAFTNSQQAPRLDDLQCQR